MGSSNHIDIIGSVTDRQGGFPRVFVSDHVDDVCFLFGGDSASEYNSSPFGHIYKLLSEVVVCIDFE